MLFLYDTVNQMGAETIERLVVTEEVRSILLQLLPAAAGVARQKKLRGEGKITDEDVWVAQPSSPEPSSDLVPWSHCCCHSPASPNPVNISNSHT